MSGVVIRSVVPSDRAPGRADGPAGRTAARPHSIRFPESNQSVDFSFTFSFRSAD
jgi:hypothetical protein